MKLTRMLTVMLAVLVLACLLLVAGCSAAPGQDTAGSTPEYTALEPPAAGADVALVTTSEWLTGDFAQAAQTAASKFAGENGLTSGVYRAEGGDPATDAGDAVRANIELAVKGGAKVILVVGSDLAEAAGEAQAEHPDIDFILLGMGPATTVLDNGVRVVFSPEQGGWLAGYAAVWEGYRTLGWLGDGTNNTNDAAQQAQATVARRSGLGFLLGAEAAARELGLEAGEVTALPPLAGGRDAPAAGSDGSEDASAEEPVPPGEGSPPGEDSSLDGDPGLDLSGAGSAVTGSSAADNADDSSYYTEAAAGLFGQGAQLVFANVPGSQGGVLAAAREADGQVIGYTLYPEGAGEMLVSVKYDPGEILGILLDAWQDGRFPGGGVALATVGNGGVGLDLAAGSLARLDEAAYEGLRESIRFNTLDSDLSQALTSLSLGEIPAPGQLPLTLVSLAPAGGGEAGESSSAP